LLESSGSEQQLSEHHFMTMKSIYESLEFNNTKEQNSKIIMMAESHTVQFRAHFVTQMPSGIVALMVLQHQR
jgi:hypothetical protein